MKTTKRRDGRRRPPARSEERRRARENRFVVSTPALDRTLADMASVTANAMRTRVTATPVSSSASGRWTRKVRSSIDALWR